MVESVAVMVCLSFRSGPDPDVARHDRVVRIRLYSDEARRAAAHTIRVVERRRACPLPGLNIREKHGVVVSLRDDLVLEPDAGHECRTRRVELHLGLVEVQVPHSVASLDLVNRSCAVLELAIGLGTDAVEILS